MANTKASVEWVSKKTQSENKREIWDGTGPKQGDVQQQTVNIFRLVERARAIGQTEKRDEKGGHSHVYYSLNLVIAQILI